MSLSPPLKKILLALAVAIGAILLAGGYYFFQITREVDTGWADTPNSVDALEARRKLRLFQEAQKVSRRGFVRLSEVELNSYLEQNFSATAAAAQTNAPGSNGLLKSFVSLNVPDVIFYCWVRKKIIGIPVDFVWQRTVRLERAADRWDFPVQAVKVGHLEIQPRDWELANRLLGGADQAFSKQFDWLAHLPGLEIAENELSRRPELRLYTYAAKAVGREAKH